MTKKQQNGEPEYEFDIQYYRRFGVDGQLVACSDRDDAACWFQCDVKATVEDGQVAESETLTLGCQHEDKFLHVLEAIEQAYPNHYSRDNGGTYDD